MAVIDIFYLGVLFTYIYIYIKWICLFGISLYSKISCHFYIENILQPSEISTTVPWHHLSFSSPASSENSKQTSNLVSIKLLTHLGIVVGYSSACRSPWPLDSLSSLTFCALWSKSILVSYSNASNNSTSDVCVSKCGKSIRCGNRAVDVFGIVNGFQSRLLISSVF